MAEKGKQTLAIPPFDCFVNVTKAYEEGEKWYLEGYAGSTELDLTGDIITEEAFKGAENDLLGNSTVLYNHDPEQPIGKVEAVQAKAEGLWVKVLISQTVPEIWQKVKEGVLNKFSIRARVINAVKKFVKELDKVVNEINELYLVEASLVALPANPEAKALRWYISKSLSDYELKGGEIPKEYIKNTAKDRIKNMPKENVMTLQELIKQLNDRLVADEDKALLKSIEAEFEKAKKPVPVDENGDPITDPKKPMMKPAMKKKSGEEWTQEAVDALEKSVSELQASLDAEKSKKVLKAMADMSEDDMKEIVAISDEIRKTHSEKYPYPDNVIKTIISLKKQSGDCYTQGEVDALAKSIEDSKVAISALEKELKELKAEKSVEKSWESLKNEYDAQDAVVIKSILKKSAMGEALKPEDTEALVTKKLHPSILVLGSGIDVSKTMTEERKQELIKKAGIRVRAK